MKNRMNIWLIKEGENLPGDGKNPRLQRTGLLAERLVKMGVDVVYWQSTYNHLKKEFRYHEDTDIKLADNYTLKLIHSCGYKKNVSIRRLIHQYITARKFYRKAMKMQTPDGIDVCMPTISLTYYAVKYARKKNIPVFVDIRDLNPDLFLSPFSGITQKIVSILIVPLKWMLSRALSRATGIIGTTEPYLQWGLNYAHRKRREKDNVFYVSYPGDNLPTTIGENSKWKEYSNYEGITCCWFGQFGQMTDYDVMIDAAELCQKNNIEARFFLCGAGEYLEKYRDIVKERKLNNVYLPGWCNQTDIVELGCISDMGILAYKNNDNFNMQIPNKFGEYLALRLAILLQPTGVMEELIEDCQCGFHFDDAVKMYEKLCYLSSHKEELAEMKKKARTLYEQKFSANIVYNEYANYLIKNFEK